MRTGAIQAEGALGCPTGGSVLPVEKIPDRLFPFDIQVALARANGKPRLLRRMLQRFRELYARAGVDLRETIAGGRIEDAHRLAHSLKGVAATLEAQELTLCAAALEDALREGLLERLPGLIEAMEVALVPAIDAAASLENDTSALEGAGDSR